MWDGWIPKVLLRLNDDPKLGVLGTNPKVEFTYDK